MAGPVTADGAASSAGWWLPATIVLAVALGTGVAFFETLEAMVSTWSKYGYFYYGHCFLVFPLSLWLIWDKRRQLARITPDPEYRVLALLLTAGSAWLLAYLADVPIAQQAALIACLVLAAWLMLGTQAARTLAFPLGFLFFALPVSTDALLPFLMQFTADATVMLLRISGFHVVQEGAGFLVEGRSWIVVELCSGNLYLAVIITAGILFSYLMAKGWRRLLFMGCTLIIPLLSNVIRTYLIVVTVQLDVPQLGSLREHEIFAEFGFWLVVAGLFLLGFLFRDPPQNNGESAPLSDTPVQMQAGAFIAAGLTALSAVLLWPGIAYAIERMQPEHSPLPRSALLAVDGAGGWRGLIDLTDNSPASSGIPVAAKFHRLYGREQRLVFLYLCRYRQLNHCAAEMQQLQQVMTPDGSVPQTSRPTHRRITLGERSLGVIQNQWHGRRGLVLSWTWYRYAGQSDAKRPLAQLWGFWSGLTQRGQDAMAIVLSTDQVENQAAGEQALLSFAESMLPKIEVVLQQSALD
ncbi:MAG: exosortase [Gammaproteobacteria bacterium]|nr:exosortase [Gammaproteobacteria bacterium]